MITFALSNKTVYPFIIVKCASAPKSLTAYQYLDFPDEIGGINQDELSTSWNEVNPPCSRST